MHEVVGEIEGHEVLYISERDVLFCKNTTVPYKQMRLALFESHIDRTQIKNDLMLSIDGGIVALGCLTTTLENCKNINTNIKKIKNYGNRIS